MGSFDVYSNYRDNAGVSGVVFGANKGLLEVELNELQDIQKHQLRNFIAKIIGDGVTDTDKITYSDGSVVIADGCTFAVNGYVINCTGLELEASNGDSIYLQIWEDQATYSSTLKEEGNQQEETTVQNWFKDSRGEDETTRRLILKYQLALTEDQNKTNLKIGSIQNGSLVLEVEGIHTGGSGIAPANMKAFAVNGGNAQATIVMNDPDDIVISGQTISTWAGTKVVMKTGSYPTSIKDGTIVLDNKVRGQYSSNGYVVTGLTNDTTYYFQAFPYSTDGAINSDVTNRATATPKEYELYRFRVNKSDNAPATKVEYLGDTAALTPASMDHVNMVFDAGSFADAFFVKNNYPVMLKFDGTEDYKLNPNDYTKKLDGTASDVANINYAGNAMSAIPTVWVKKWTESGYDYFNVSDTEIDNTYEAVRHTNKNGKVLDYVYEPMFRGSLDGNNKLRSISGQTVMASKTAEQEIAYAIANGTGWFTPDKAWIDLRNILFMLMFKTTQGEDLGYGNCSSSAVLATGTLNDKGGFYGYGDQTHQVKFMHQEAPWGDQWLRIAGWVVYNNKQYTKLTNGDYPQTGLTTWSTFSSKFTEAGAVPSEVSGNFISDITFDADKGDIPRALSGSETTGFCDKFWYGTTSGTVYYARVGGRYDDARVDGAFCCRLDGDASHTDAALGSAVSFTDQSAA